MTKLALFQEGRLIQYSKSINVIHMTKEEKSDNINRSKGTPIIRFPDTDFKINMLKAFKEIKDMKNSTEN